MTNEKLELIAAKCRELTAIYDNAEPHVKLAAYAGWRSTIAAISAHDAMDGGAEKHFLALEILDAWEGLV